MTHLPQSLPYIVPELHGLHSPVLKEGRKRLGEASAGDTYFWKRDESAIKAIHVHGS